MDGPENAVSPSAPVPLTVVILTKNEEKHIERALSSVCGIAERIVVIDSGSTDATIELARAGGARVLSHAFVNQAQQFNWALDNLPDDTVWVLRLDADEIVSPELAEQITQTLPRLPEGFDGITIGRRIAFLGRPIRHGGLFPIRVLRIFRHGKGRCEDRWMDEHIVVGGEVVDLPGEILDNNLNSLTWWTEKHNGYASREVIELLNLEYRFLPARPAGHSHGGQVGKKRWVKENVYARMPGGIRVLVYFVYRYVLRLGFLDGREGLAFHVLQGFWYRFLVDQKLTEVRRLIEDRGMSPVDAIREVTGIDIAPGATGSKDPQRQ